MTEARSQPGSTTGRYYRDDFPGQIVVERFIDVPLEARGSFRQDAQVNLSFRLEKNFNVKIRRRKTKANRRSDQARQC